MNKNKVFQTAHRNLVKEQLKKQVLEIVESRENELITRTTLYIFALMLTVAHDKFGFRKKRMDRLVDELFNGFDSVGLNDENKDFGCSFDDLINLCKDEFGIDLVVINAERRKG